MVFLLDEDKLSKKIENPDIVSNVWLWRCNLLFFLSCIDRVLEQVLILLEKTCSTLLGARGAYIVQTLLIGGLILKELFPKSNDRVAELNVVPIAFFIMPPISKRFADGSDILDMLRGKRSRHLRQMNR